MHDALRSAVAAVDLWRQDGREVPRDRGGDLTFRNLEFARAQSSKYHSILLLQRDIVQKSSWDVWCFERKICKVATQYFSECDQIEKSISKNLEDIDSNLGAFDWFVSRSWSPSLLPVDPPVSLVSHL